MKLVQTLRIVAILLLLIMMAGTAGATTIIFNGSSGWQNTSFDNTTQNGLDTNNIVVGDIPSDYFDTSDTTTLSSTWNEMGVGTIKISSGVLNLTTPTTTGILASNYNQSIYTLKFKYVDLNISSTGSYIGVFIYMANNSLTSQGYAVRLRDQSTDAALINATSGANIDLSASGGTAVYLNDSTIVTLKINNSNILIWYNNTYRGQLDFGSAPFYTSGSLGFGSRTVNAELGIDDVRTLIQNQTSGNITLWTDFGSGRQSSSYTVNATGNYSVSERQNNTGDYVLVNTYTTSDLLTWNNQTITPTTKYQFPDVRVQLLGNFTNSPVVNSISVTDESSGGIALNCTDEGSDGILDNITTVSTNSSQSNCYTDGTEDQVEIQYANDNSTNGSEVRLYNGTYILNNTLYINKSIIFSGNGTDSHIKAINNASNTTWTQLVPMVNLNSDNITVQDLRLDSDYDNQTLGAGLNYLDIMHVNGDNILIQNNLFDDGLCDAIDGKNLASNLTVKDNIFNDIDHDAVAGTYTNSIIENNTVAIIATNHGGNSAFRLNYGNNNIWRNNYINGTNAAKSRVITFGLEIHSYNNNNVSNGTIQNNTILDTYAGAIIFDGSGGTPSSDYTKVRSFTIKNNIIHNVSQYNTLPNMSNGIKIEDAYYNNFTIENNDIIGVSKDGIWLDNNTRDISIRNNIIINNSMNGIFSNGASNLTITYNNVWNNTFLDYNGTTTGTGNISANPLFISSSDFHLQGNQTWNGTAWVHYNTDSPAIGAGDPTIAITNCPSWGCPSIVEMGAYGNTAEASQGASTFTPSNNIIYCPTGWCHLAQNRTNYTLLQIDSLFTTDVVQGWFNSTSQKFESHSKYSSNQDANVTMKYGYYYYFSTPTTVYVNITSNPSINLLTGWNLVGNMDTNRTLLQLKTSIGASAITASHWNSTSQQYLNDDTEIVPVGESFFVNVNANSSWSG